MNLNSRLKRKIQNIMFVIRARYRDLFLYVTLALHNSFAEESFAELLSKTGDWTGVSMYGVVAWEPFSVRDCILSIRGEQE